MNLGVIGAGGIAYRRTIPEVVQNLNDVKVTSVMDIDAEAVAKVAAEFNVPHHCTTEAELLARDDVDAVYIATPQNEHCRQAIMAAEAGKHILLEKPMGISVEECLKIDAACKKAGVTLMLGFMMHFNPNNRKAMELAQAGSLGKFVMGRAQLTCWYPPIPGAWRQDLSVSHGGSLIDMGTHCLDLLEWIMGSPIYEVSAFQNRLTHEYPTEIEDTSTVILRFENGAHGVVDNYFNVPDAAAQNALELYGTKGCLVAHGTIGQDPTGEMFTVIHEQGAYSAKQERNTEPEREEYRLDHEGNYSAMVAHFAEAVRTGTTPAISAEDGIRSARLVEAIYTAAREGRSVRVNA